MDSTALVWDLRLGSGAPAGGRPLARVGTLWADLGGDNAAVAYQAQDELARSANAAGILSARLRAVPVTGRRSLERWVAQLDDDDFRMRRRATRELARRAEEAAPLLRKAAEESPSPEMRRRALDLVASLGSLSGERLRAVRAVEVLEAVGTPEARELLHSLAKGAPGARLTQEAKAALRRLEGRSPAK